MEITQSISLYNQKLTESEFKRVQDFMLNNLGVKLAPIKIVMVNSRLIKRLRATGIGSFTQYLDFALSAEGKQNGELERMIDELTTHKTEFFRESDHFDFMENKALPDFFNQGRNHFKIWSAGCSTGEEPYTMSMVLSEFALKNRGFEFTIHASDISQGVLATAVRAIYNYDSISDLDLQLVKRYFLRNRDYTSNQVRINKNLRDRVHFFIQNLVDEYPFQNDSLDMVFCRNTLIYFDEKSKIDVVNRLIRKVRPGGYFIVGLSETVSQYSTAIKQIQPSVYMKLNNKVNDSNI
jgi:chemotaxis protein methyltransferase CheR